VSGHYLTGRGTHKEGQEVSGHDFSRAENASFSAWASAPANAHLEALLYELTLRAFTSGYIAIAARGAAIKPLNPSNRFSNRSLECQKPHQIKDGQPQSSGSNIQPDFTTGVAQ
jgi:hypothetical protein